jgi:hypothetical protein
MKKTNLKRDNMKKEQNRIGGNRTSLSNSSSYIPGL